MRAQNIIEVGKRLIEAKKQVAHGEWVGWLSKNVSYTDLAQMTELLSLPEPEVQNFMESKTEEGNPVEDMTVKTLRQEIKDWKQLQAGMNHVGRRKKG